MRSLQCVLRRLTTPRAVGWALGFILLALSAPAQAQTGTVEGRVTAEGTGRPIAGAQVAIVGTTIGARTDQDGRFVLLNVPTGARQLRVTAIGHAQGTLQFNVGSGVTTANLELSASVLRLDEVVVTGTAGQARRREIGNTISQINAADVADPPSSVNQLLAGRAAGVNVTQTNGMAGAGSQIRLRGAVSVSQSNQPIVYVDGVRVRSEGFRRNRPIPGTDFTGRSGNIELSPLDNINPDNIERIEIIKGAAATTLYGTEAAAGVIQIFTKKGQANSTQWTFQTDQGFGHLLKFGTDENPFLNLKPCSRGTSCSQTSDSPKGKCYDQNPDPNCEWLRDAYRAKYAASVGGGSEGFQYFVSGSWENYDGVLPLDNDKNLSTRANFNFNLNDNLRVDWNTAYSNRRVSNTPAGNNAHGLTLNVFRAERNYFGSNDPALVQQLLNQSITSRIDRLVTGATVHYSPLPNFTHRLTVGWDLAQQENRNLRPFGFVRLPTGRLLDEQVRYTTLTGDYVGTFNYDVTETITNNFSFGGQAVTTEFARTAAQGDQFGGPGIPTVGNAGQKLADESRQRVVNAGFFFQDRVGISDRLFVTGGVRFDGNSAFGENLGLEGYPKASVSYVISDESFFPENLGTWKLRAAYGFSGRAPGAFDAVRVWSSTATLGNNPAFLPSNVGNPDLGPERTREIELGFDAALFDNRVSAEFTWYHQKTTDALFAVRQIPTLGFGGSQLANVGAIRNAGIEATINATILDQQDFGIDLGSSFYTNHSLVLDLGDAVPFGAGGGWVEVGFPVMAANGTQIRNPDAIADPDSACITKCNSNGEFMFGPQQPTFVWQPNITVRLPRGIRFSARGELQAGAYIYDGASNQGFRRGILWPTCSRAHGILFGPDGVEGTADDGPVSQLTARERVNCISTNNEAKAQWFSADFFKMRDMTLSVPVDFLVPQVRSALLRISAQNWARWINNDLKMFDPEMVGRNSVSSQNRGIAEHIPAPAIFTASLRITF